MPIRNLIVLAPSGLVLFEKEYSKEKIAQPRLARFTVNSDDRVRDANHGDAAVLHRDVFSCCYYVPRRQRDVRLSS